MKHATFVFILVLTLTPLPALADTDSDSTRAASPTVTGPTWGLGAALIPRHFLRDRADTGTGQASMALSLSAMHWYAPPTRFEATLHGLGTGATFGMFLGAIGNTLGWFDEDTTWLITGAMAAAAGAYSGAMYREGPTLQLQLGGADDDERTPR